MSNLPHDSSGFRDWLLARQGEIETYGARNRGQKFPIFVVAAQGGGYYAAYHSALFLARVADRCPNFGQHVFAISSVSGGSLGAAVFTEALRHRMR